jgi:hypothetical protein
MKLIRLIEKFLILLGLIILGGCDGTPEPDPCLITKWPQSKEYEITLAINVNSANPLLPGGTAGSKNPEDFRKLAVSGTIEKFECNGSSLGPIDLGNCYVFKDVDYPAPVNEPGSYFIGHVVYVLEFDNDKDLLEMNFNVRITMADGQSYTCNVLGEANQTQLQLVPGQMYYYILINIYSDLWTKV